MGVWLLMLSAAAAPPPERCAERGDRTSLLTEFEMAVLEGRISEAEEVKTRILEALSCGELVERRWLARWWLGEAVISSLLGDEHPTDDALAAAARIAPDVWVEGYGPTFRQRYSHIIADVQVPTERFAASGRILVEMPRDHTPDLSIVVGLDGLVTEGPIIETEAGYHLLQIGSAPTDIQYGSIVYVVPAQDLVVRVPVGIVPPPDPALIPAPAIPTRAPLPAFGIAGGLLGTAAFITALLAIDENRVMRDAPNIPTLDASFQRQRALAAASYTLMAGSAAAVGLQVAVIVDRGRSR